VDDRKDDNTIVVITIVSVVIYGRNVVERSIANDFIINDIFTLLGPYRTAEGVVLVNIKD